MTDQVNNADMETAPVAEAAGGEPAVQIATTNDKGRCLMSTSEIPSGSIVFHEEPFIFCVNDVCEFKNCNFCLRAIQEQYEGHKMCRECGLSAYCCGDCRRESKHDILECRVFQVRCILGIPALLYSIFSSSCIRLWPTAMILEDRIPKSDMRPACCCA
jgi:hypothetical protein